MARITNREILVEVQKLIARVTAMETRFDTIAERVNGLAEKINKIDGILRGETANGGLVSKQHETDVEIKALMEEMKKRKERELAIILLFISNLITILFEIIKEWR